MQKLFRFKPLSSKAERTVGFCLRFLGVDFSFLLLGYVSDWRLIDLRVPAGSGVYLQVLFVFTGVGILGDEFYGMEP